MNTDYDYSIYTGLRMRIIGTWYITSMFISPHPKHILHSLDSRFDPENNYFDKIAWDMNYRHHERLAIDAVSSYLYTFITQY